MQGGAWVVASAVLVSQAAAASSPAPAAMTTSGSVHGLAPGVPAELVVTIANTGGTAGQVSYVDVQVTGGPPACPPSSLTVEPWSGSVQVPPGGEVQQVMTVVLDAGATCQAASWDLTFTSS